MGSKGILVEALQNKGETAESANRIADAIIEMASQDLNNMSEKKAEKAESRNLEAFENDIAPNENALEVYKSYAENGTAAVLIVASHLESIAVS